MPNLLPESLKEPLERAHEKFSRFIDKLRPGKSEGGVLEHVTSDLLPAFMQFGGPLLDMHETATELIVTAEVPGLNKDDFSVELIGRRLSIQGEKKISREQKSGSSFFSECRYGSFSRSLQLPYDIDDSKIKADLKDGILTVRMPKPESEQGRRHRVTVS